MVVKENNQTGAKFLACNNFPACKNSKPMPKKDKFDGLTDEEIHYQVKPKEDKVEVVDMVKKAARDYAVKNDNKVYKHLTEPEDDYEEDLFQIKSKQVRSNALASAIEIHPNFDDAALIRTAKEFEKYIRFGE